MHHSPARKIGPRGGTSSHGADPPLLSFPPCAERGVPRPPLQSPGISNEGEDTNGDAVEISNSDQSEDVGHDICEGTSGCATRRERRQDFAAKDCGKGVIIVELEKHCILQ